MMARSAAQWPLWPLLPTKYRLSSIQRSTLTAFTFVQSLFIQFVYQEHSRLQTKAAALQTAKGAYLQALKASLPVVGGSDTIKFSGQFVLICSKLSLR